MGGLKRREMKKDALMDCVPLPNKPQVCSKLYTCELES